MSVYVANENGDWWEASEPMTLFVLDTDKLPPALIQEVREQLCLDDDEELLQEDLIEELTNTDKFGNCIQDFGTLKTITF